MRDGYETAIAVIVMGVTGAGKTTIGRLLAEQTGWPFYDADDFHPAVNVEKMRQGIPLVDDDRLPWLKALHTLISESLQRDASLVVACSALREAYRHVLSEGDGRVRFVHLAASREVIEGRLTARVGHFMNPRLVASQFQTLEVPADALTVDAGATPEEIVSEIRQRFSA